jgi:hypothetical protein
MTTQISDIFLYNGEEYSLVEAYGKRLIKPQDYGMNPRTLSTACRRGFYSTYKIIDDSLFLIEMIIGEVGRGWKPIQGIMPTSEPYICHRASESSLWYCDGTTEEEARLLGHEILVNYTDYSYKNLKIFTSFSGYLHLGKDIIEEQAYSGAHHHSYGSYKTVLELKFKKGRLVFVKDISLNKSLNWQAFKNLLKEAVLFIALYIFIFLFFL